MCATCGCSGTAVVRLFPADWAGAAEAEHRPGLEHQHHGPGHEHQHEHAGQEHRGAERILRLAGREDERTIQLEQKVLAKNDRLAELNRDWLRQRSVLAVNLMSSPGAGKTTLLERTARELAGKVTISVIEGDQAAALDATRIRATGCEVVQINTGAGCHLDAEMVAEGLRVLDPPSGSVVMIENVGNLVCPSLFDLGEQARVVLASVTEGDDKPLKYPHMFRRADLVVVSKTDLLPYVDFDSKRHAADVRRTSPDALMLQLSAATGAGMQEWYDWLRRRTPPPQD
ncbi:MAG TPA: hydrogenase nickel incorporation protein HypB [Streptosporangiaceae bacterium]|nr:hydrogenase nickel incorporation protein HypB [Streptosporangiaceae bacterium]